MPEDGAGQLRSPGAHQARHPQNFPVAEVETDVIDVAISQTADLQRHLPRIMPAGAQVVSHVAPHHPPHQLPLVYLRGLLRADGTAVAEHGDAIGQAEDLLQAV